MSLTWDKKIRFQWRHGGGFGNKVTTVAHALTLGTVGSIRAVLRSDDGTGHEILCYQSADWNPATDTGTWTQIGTTLTGTESSTMVVATGDLQLCYSAIASSNPVTEVCYASVRPYLGAEVASFNPLAVVSTAIRTPTTYADAQGNVWTIAGTYWSWLT